MFGQNLAVHSKLTLPSNAPTQIGHLFDEDDESYDTVSEPLISTSIVKQKTIFEESDDEIGMDTNNINNATVSINEVLNHEYFGKNVSVWN
jgi:hypothetical protein